MMTPSTTLELCLASGRRRLLDDGTWAAIGQVGAALGSLVGVRLMTEFLPPGVFGKVALLVGLSIFGSNLLCMPFYQATQRFYADALKDASISRLRRISVGMLRWSGLTLVISFLVGGGIWAANGFGSFWAMALLAALVPLEMARAFEITLLGAARRQRPYGLWTAFEAWMKPLLAVLVVRLAGPSPETVLLGYLLATALGLVVFRYAVKGEGLEAGSPSAAPRTEMKRDMIRFALPLMPLAIASWICSLGDRYVIGGFMGLEWVGIYAATYGLVSRPFLMMGTIVGQTLKPVYFNSVAHQDQARARQILGWWLGLAGLFGVLGALGVLLLRNWIATFLLAENFRTGVNLIPWIAAGYAAQMIATVFEGVLYARHQTGCIALVQAIVAVVSLATAALGAIWAGLIGVAMACPVYFSVQALLNAGCVLWRKPPTRPPSSKTAPVDKEHFLATADSKGGSTWDQS